jgi:hypothetical protein
MDSLKEKVQHLLDKKKEGVYWDFKEEFTHNNIDLIHDVICLSNVEHEGDRYLIYGVTDNYEIVGISDTKRQADIIDTLRNAKFSDGVFPDISLEAIDINGKNIQVIVMKNKANKPYYLTDDKQEHKKYLRAGTVYTRIMDTNTPRNSVALFHQNIELYNEFIKN